MTLDRLLSCYTKFLKYTVIAHQLIHFIETCYWIFAILNGLWSISCLLNDHSMYVVTIGSMKWNRLHSFNNFKQWAYTIRFISIALKHPFVSNIWPLNDCPFSNDDLHQRILLNMQTNLIIFPIDHATSYFLWLKFNPPRKSKYLQNVRILSLFMKKKEKNLYT